MCYFTLKLELASFILWVILLSNLKLKVFASPVSNAPNDLGNQIHDMNKSNNNNDSNNNDNIIITIIIIIIIMKD